MYLRPATPDDLADIAALHAANWRAAYRGVFPDEVLGAPLTEDAKRRWAALPAPDAGFVLVAEDEEGLAGYGFVALGLDDGPCLNNLHVSADRQGAGLGEALLRALALRLAQGGHDRMWLLVMDSNHGARRFYARLGGVEGPVFTDRLLGQPVLARPVAWSSLGPLTGPT